MTTGSRESNIGQEQSLAGYVKGIKGVIFDYGGTLDTGGDHWSEVLRAGYIHSGVEIDYADFREAYVYAERELARTRHILPGHDFSDLLRIKVRIELERLCEMGKFNPGEVESKGEEIARYCYGQARDHVRKAVPVLKRIASRYPMVLVSNFYGNIRSVLADFGIDGMFRSIIESAVVGVRKPNPAIFTLGVKELGVDAGETLVVGDSYGKDIEPALKAGCRAVWIKGKGWTAEEDARTYPYTIGDLSQLPF